MICYEAETHITKESLPLDLFLAKTHLSFGEGLEIIVSVYCHCLRVLICICILVISDISLTSGQLSFVSVCSKIDELKYSADQIKFHQEQQNQHQLNIARLCGTSALPQERQINQQSRLGTDFAGVSGPQLKALGSLFDGASKNVPNAHSSGASQPNVRSQYNCEGSPCASRSFSGVLEGTCFVYVFFDIGNEIWKNFLPRLMKKLS